MVDTCKLQSGDKLVITDYYGNKSFVIVKSVDNEGITVIGSANEKPVARPIRDVQLLNNFTTNSRRYYYYHKGDKSICDQ